VVTYELTGVSSSDCDVTFEEEEMDLEIKLPDESRTMSFNIELGKCLLCFLLSDLCSLPFALSVCYYNSAVAFLPSSIELLCDASR
jgi:hypothetical protein